MHQYKIPETVVRLVPTPLGTGRGEERANRSCPGNQSVPFLAFSFILLQKTFHLACAFHVSTTDALAQSDKNGVMFADVL